MPEIRKPNRLINETSPYLLQHAHNPVDWWPWCDEAFEEAQRRDLPVMLSSGYASCHWCHVMERECFEDDEVAQALNDGFICVKLDREERPDVDEVYMNALVAMTGQGGWPMTVFMTGDKLPFFAGSYFPKHGSRGMPGFLDILAGVESLWRDRRDQLMTTARLLTDSISAPPDAGEGSLKDVAEKAASQLMSVFDREHGGFMHAPKFPSAHHLMFLMRYAKDLPMSEGAWFAVSHTLDSMMRGGIQDHVGGGFFRYAVDAAWRTPHFEKMLIDQAMLAMTYIEGWQAMQKLGYAQTARRALDYAMRELGGPGGGFLSAQDADSEGEEGKYYRFSRGQLKEALGADADEFIDMYLADGGDVLNLTGGAVSADRAAVAARGMVKLFLARSQRVPPGVDDKSTLLGNGLMIAALAKCGRAMGAEGYVSRAVEAARFVEKVMTHGNHLIGSHRDTGVRQPLAPPPQATLAAYAAYVWGLIELNQATLSPEWLRLARRWHGRAMELFMGEDGVLYNAASGVHDLPIRPRDAQDNAHPSGQSMTAMNAIRLSRLCGDIDMEESARGILRGLSGAVAEVPAAYTALLCAQLYLEDGGVEVKLSRGAGFVSLRRALDGFEPFLQIMVAQKRSGASGGGVRRVGESAPASAVVCRGGVCALPVTSPSEMRLRIRCP